MKHLENNIWIILTAVIILIISPVNHAKAQNGPYETFSEITQKESESLDSIEISLLTCSPHEEIYSLYGHTALRYHNMKTGEDIAFNWGIFNFNAPYFIGRFILGLTDYELGLTPFEPFCQYYKKWGSSVSEQVLNLSAIEKKQILQALSVNLLPNNRIYRYNFFFDNCSTRPRDIIKRNLSGKIVYDESVTEKNLSYRQMIHLCTRNHPWASFGNDILLGLKADFPTSREQQEFLPENLMYDFDHAKVYANGQYHSLVKEHRIPVTPGVQLIEKEFPLSPTQCFIVLLVVSIIIAIYESKRHKTFKYWDVTLMLVQGLSGCVLFLMLFSEHPTTSSNLQIFLLNPLPLYFIPNVLRRRKTYWWNVLAIMIILFYLGSFFQTYAEGMRIVALCLLTRIISHYINEK